MVGGMAGSSLPPSLEPLRSRTFAFYPAILNVEYNEWRFRKASWSEICVINAKSDLEIWLPRRLIGEVSSIGEPVIIVGLRKELEYKAGTVWPHERRILEMPRAAAEPPDSVAAAQSPDAASAPGAGRAEGAESRVGRLVAITLGVVLLAVALVYAVAKLAPLRSVRFTTVDQDVLSLTRHDDYYSIVRKLGPPAQDRWRSEAGELQYRALWYPRRSCYLILVGPDRNDAHYAGALDGNWRVLHSVELPGGADTASMLRALPKF
jgi:hypothetical protein